MNPCPPPFVHTSRIFWGCVLFFQVISCLILGWLGHKLPFDNRIDRFAVKGQQAEKAYKIFHENFAAPELFLVVLEAKTPLKLQPWSQGEALFETLGRLPGVQSYQSLESVLPPGSSFEVEELPFPFITEAQNCYVALFEWQDLPNRDSQLRLFQEKAIQLQKEAPDQIQKIWLAGEPFVNYQLNISSLEVKNRFFPLLIILSLLFLGLLFRSFRILVVTGLSVGTALAWTTGIMALLGESMNLVTTLIPALIFVLAIAMQVHVLIGIGLHGDVSKGVISKLKPNFLVALTTSLGFGSLMLSHVEPIAIMGRFMALGIWIIFFWSHATHLGISMLCKLSVTVPDLPFFNQVSRSSAYQGWSQKKPWLFIFATLICLGAWWLPRNPTESNGLMYFKDHHPIRQTTAFLEKEVTGASQLELLLPALPNQASWLEQLELIAQIEARLKTIEGVRHVLSANTMVTFSQTLLPAMNTQAAWNLLSNFQPDLFNRYQHPEFYRIQLLVNSVDKEGFDRMQAKIDSALASTAWNQSGLLTGPLTRIIEIQRYLLQSLGKSLGITICLVLVLMMIFLRVLQQPAVILLPNLFPLGMMALMMGLFGIQTTISSVMVFSIAFGIAVDDTIHLLHTYHQQNAPTFWERWQATFCQDAKAISLTTLCLTGGFLVLVTSEFSPTQDFGILMGFGMISALLGDLLCLPPLLFRKKEQAP